MDQFAGNGQLSGNDSALAVALHGINEFAELRKLVLEVLQLRQRRKTGDNTADLPGKFLIAAQYGDPQVQILFECDFQANRLNSLQNSR